MKIVLLLFFSVLLLLTMGCLGEKSNDGLGSEIKADSSLASDASSAGQKNDISDYDFEKMVLEIGKECNGTSGMGFFTITCENKRGIEKYGDGYCDRINGLALTKCDNSDTTLQSMCESNVHDFYSSCVRELAVAREDDSICDKLNNVSSGICKYYVSTMADEKKASNPSGLDDCEKLNTLSIPTCIRNLAVKEKDSSLCEKIDNSLQQPYCYFFVAIKLNDLQLCEKAGSSKQVCYYSLASARKDVSVCEKLRDEQQVGGLSYFDKCLFEVAKSKSDVSLCPESVDFCSLIVKKDYPGCNGDQKCIYLIALNNDDLEGCNRLTGTDSDHDKEQCVVYVATDLKDKSVCSQAGNMRGFCEARVDMFKDIPISGDMLIE